MKPIIEGLYGLMFTQEGKTKDELPYKEKAVTVICMISAVVIIYLALMAF